MKVHNSAWIEALVDDQLTGWRRWYVRRHVSRCPACATTYRRHRHVREMLAENPSLTPMNDSAEGFWSNVRRAIEAQSPEAGTQPVEAPRLGWADWLWLRPAVVPVASMVTLVLLASLAWFVWGPVRPSGGAPLPQVTAVDTTIPNAVATPFNDADAEVTVIWVSGLPWTPDMTALQTTFAHLDS